VESWIFKRILRHRSSVVQGFLGSSINSRRRLIMKLYFKKATIVKIIAAVEAGTGHQRPYTGEPWGVPADYTPGILLVGDKGIYIIGNEEPEVAPIESGLVAYAKGCDPRKDRGWREMKEDIWGGDDGGEFLSLDEAKRLLLLGPRPFVEISETEIVYGS
jgi:hypothetical protein